LAQAQASQLKPFCAISRTFGSHFADMVRFSARQVFSATRTHFPPTTTELPEDVVSNLKKYAISTQALGIAGAVAVNRLEDQVRAVIAEAAPEADIEVLHVPVWGAFVPALNTLLGEAQRRRSKFILFQSLEVVCDPAVLRKLLDWHTSETLVVGPVLNGHTYVEGKQVLNGRTTPWNTLALWSTRKLGLTGFLSVAEGLPDANAVTRQISGDSDDGTPRPPAMGSEAWWEGTMPGGLPQVMRQKSVAGEVPAGVEEVTAIALLQHLLGEAEARAVLIDLPKSMEDKVSWKTNWDGDEKRRQWHEHKMKTKITRPAAQMKKLFGLGRRGSGMAAPLLPFSKTRASEEASTQDQQLQFGYVHHFSESVAPPRQVEWICMLCSALFMANFSSAFATAFHAINHGHPVVQTITAPSMMFVGLLLAGVYIPMPVSLVFFRWLSNVAGQRAGLLFFAGLMALTQAGHALVLAVAEGESSVDHVAWMVVRLLQGLGGAVLFQTRFILSQLSTQDNHVRLQAKTFLAGDLGLGVGAVLPIVCGRLGEVSSTRAMTERPEVLSAVVFAALAAALLTWIWIAFPSSVYRLSHRVRFPELPRAEAQRVLEGQQKTESNESVNVRSESGALGRVMLLLSGSLRVFVQSASLMAIAIHMSDVGDVGFFHQCCAVALLCFIPAPFEAFASGLCRRRASSGMQAQAGRLSFVLLVVAALLCMFTTLGSWEATSRRSTGIFVAELVLSQISLALVAPSNVSRLYRHKHVERSLVTLEWAKAYVGRILGPIAVLVVHSVFGFAPVLLMLFGGTFLVAATA